MTTKPKAKKFRIRRAAPVAGSHGGASDSAALPDSRITGLSDAPVSQRRAPNTSLGAAIGAAPGSPASARQPVQQLAPARQPVAGHAPSQAQPQAQPQARQPTNPSAPPTPEQDIDTIKREGLTGRQLRMARRVAQKHGLAATSDYDAVRLLREDGIDPFQRTNMLELVVPSAGSKGKDSGMPKIQLPQTMSHDKNQLPSTETMSPSERRVHEIGKIQRDIATRRRRKLVLLLSRLVAFVFLPTLVAGWYFYVIATPMYATKSEFLIIQAEGSGGGLGGLFSGSSLATSQDSVATQSFLQSKEVMIRLDNDVGFKSYFADLSVDPLQRLDPNPSNEQAYKLYKKYVKVGYDPTEGVIRMEVSAPTPDLSERMSIGLINYAETRIDELSLNKRNDQMGQARITLEEAKVERRTAQTKLVEIQSQTLLDPEGVIASLRSQINNIEVQLLEKELFLQQLLDNSRPNKARVDGAQGDIRRLVNQLTLLKSKMQDASGGEASLAEQSVQIQIAQADLATADLFLQNALQSVKQTEMEANRQVRYLTTNVKPVASEDPSYPRSFENTVLAFLIFSGIYLMISLTASILREQVSS